jgi:hypothetical protein
MFESGGEFMSSTYDIIFGIAIIIVGLSAVVFNKYPGQKISYENAKKKFITANERRISLFDGIFLMLFGFAYIKLGIIYLTVLLAAYYPVRFALLKLKFL